MRLVPVRRPTVLAAPLVLLGAAAPRALLAACTTPPDFAGLASATNARSATCTVNLAWPAASPSCGGTVTYSVYRSRVPGFTPSEANRIASGLSTNAYADTTNLAFATDYRYVVRATEIADAAIEDGNSVERRAVPTGALSPATFFDDFDANRPANAAAWWTRQAKSGSTASLDIVSECRWQSPTSAYRFGSSTAACGGSYSNGTDVLLILGGDGSIDPLVDGLEIPASGSQGAGFRLWYNLESGWDGAWLVYTTTGADTPYDSWIPVEDSMSASAPYIASGGYDTTISGFPSRRAWSAGIANPNGSLKQVTVNLAALAGQRVWLGIQFHTDSSVVREGLYLDDVSVDTLAPDTCTTATAPPGPAVGLRISGLPASTSAGIPKSFAVEAIDAAEQVATGYTGPAVFTSGDPRAALPSETAFTDGVAGGLAVTFGTAGTQSLTVTDSGDPALGASASVEVTAGPAAKLAFTVEPSSTVAGVAITPAVQVEVRDSYDNPVLSASDLVTVELGANPGGGPLGGTATTAATAGVATFPDLTVNRAASGYTLIAIAPDLLAATSDPFDVAPAAPHHLAFDEQPASTTAGAPFAPAPTVSVRDAFDNRTDSTATVTVALEANPVAAPLFGTTTAAAVAGLAGFPSLWLEAAGSGFTLAATAPPLLGATSQPFDVAPDSPHHAAIVQQPSDVVVDVAMAPPVAVAVRDRYDNLCTGYANPVHLALLNNPGGAALLGTTSVVPTVGIASFPSLRVSATGANYTLFAGASGLYGATSVGFDVRELGTWIADFESGDLGEWSSSAPAALVATPLAAPQDQLTAEVDLAAAARSLRPGVAVPLLVAAGGDGTAAFALSLRQPAEGSGLEISATVAGREPTAWQALGEAPARLQVAWWRGTGGRADGLLLVDGDGRGLLALDGLSDPGSAVAVLWHAADAPPPRLGD